MGNSQNKQNPNTDIPEYGSRVIEITNPQLEGQINLFTDYIVAPPLAAIKSSESAIEVTLYSIIDSQTRKYSLPIRGHHIGITVKQTTVNDSMLKVTRVFVGSPCEQVGIRAGEYIVGLVEAEYQHLKGFAQVVKGLMNKKKDVIHMAICDMTGKTRIVPVPHALLEEWKTQNKGILGCELAEGWMNRFKPKNKDERKVEESRVELVVPEASKQKEMEEKETQDLSEDAVRDQMRVINKHSSEDGEQEWEEVERKCGQLRGHGREVIEVKFKGLLKNEYLDDASTICKCKIYDKNCERCFVEKENRFYFFNKKTNRIITIPSALLLRVEDE